jgi:hypothetical protein
LCNFRGKRFSCAWIYVCFIYLRISHGCSLRCINEKHWSSSHLQNIETLSHVTLS